MFHRHSKQHNTFGDHKSSDIGGHSKDVKWNLFNCVSYFSFILNMVLFIIILRPVHDMDMIGGGGDNTLHSTSLTFHGGHPSSHDITGTCWCGEDSYCMCNPSLAIDLVIVTKKNEKDDSIVNDDDYVWLVQRKDTDQLATMGGFVQVGETVEDAVRVRTA